MKAQLATAEASHMYTLCFQLLHPSKQPRHKRLKWEGSGSS